MKSKTIRFLQLSVYMILVQSFYGNPGNALEETLVQISDCVCPGYKLIYKCTVRGTNRAHVHSTVWRGTAFDCSNNIDGSMDVILSHHNNFRSTVRMCNNGSIVAEGVSIKDGYYISQLSVIVSPDLIGQTVECYHDNGFNDSTVGKMTISNNSDSYPPPTKIFISSADFVSRELTFNWNPVPLHCPAIQYNLWTLNCGSCSTPTRNTVVTCSNVPSDGSQCTFAVQALVCNHIFGNLSDTINVNLTTATTAAVFNATELAVLITVIIFLAISVLACTAITIRRWFTSNLKSKRSRDRSSGSQTVHCVKDDDYVCAAVKIFDNEKMGTYGFEDSSSENTTIQESQPLPVFNADQPVDLNSLLLRLRGHITSQWYLFGLAFGVPKEILEQLRRYPREQCLVEVLDYWLRHHDGQPTWEQVVVAQEKIKFHLLVNDTENAHCDSSTVHKSGSHTFQLSTESQFKA